MSNEITNIIVSKKEKEKKTKNFICCKCPNCKTIFTIVPKRRIETYSAMIRNCPWCKVKENWFYYKIPVWVYKFIRSWREPEEKPY